MARRRKTQEVDPATKARIRQARSRERREAKKLAKQERMEEAKVGDTSWLLTDLCISTAKKIIDRDKSRPFWLSIPFEKGDGNPPVSGFYPCSMFRTRDRCYYGFLFRDHREQFFFHVNDARRELTDTVRRIAPHLVN